MTAIAAVLALSSTPVAAQEATSTDLPLVTVPAPEPVAPAVDPLAPTPEAEVATPAETMATTESPDAAEAVSVAVKTEKVAAKAQRTAAPVAKASALEAAATTAQTAEAIPPATVPVAQTAPVAEAAPVEQANAEPAIDEAIPLAGGAGAVILALAGAGMAIRRRKRHEDEDGELQDEMVLTDEIRPEPIWTPPVVQPRADPVATARTDEPKDFDTSRFVRHVRAAYAGPTAENPYLSLRKRLKMAGELDRRERLNGTAPTATRPAHQPSGFMLRGTASPARKPEYQF